MLSLAPSLESFIIFLIHIVVWGLFLYAIFLLTWWFLLPEELKTKLQKIFDEYREKIIKKYPFLG